ncbi:hypothetical protein ACWEO4_36830 [Streptomyces sp. NPDC004393]|uniref:hypothetical protein n=1 Tax=Streptomyces sp. NPDC004533 TaxID=3154278 RepID=UPI0033A74BBB
MTLRLMSAWSAKDSESFDALFTAAAGDPGASDQVRDLFVFALEWAQDKAVSSVNPQSLVHAVCKALKEHGPSFWEWKRPAADSGQTLRRSAKGSPRLRVRCAGKTGRQSAAVCPGG